MLVPLVCPHCRQALKNNGSLWRCDNCAINYPSHDGIVCFLTSEEDFNPGDFKSAQKGHWTDSALLRDRIRKSALLSTINSLRIRTSISGRRDRIFLKAMARDKGRKDRKILDLGCGGGRHYFSNYGKVVGVDPILDLLVTAKEIYQDVYQASAFELPFPDECFDWVVSSDVLGHIFFKDKDKLFSEMFRVLKKGGLSVHVIEIQSQNFWFRFAKTYPDLFNKYFIEVPGHFGMESASDLNARFNKHGFTEVKFETMAGAVPEVGTIAAAFDNEYSRKSGMVGACVKLDKILAKSMIVKELLNIPMELLAKLEDVLVPRNGSGALVIYRK